MLPKLATLIVVFGASPEQAPAERNPAGWPVAYRLVPAEGAEARCEAREVAFSPDGKTLAVGCKGGEVELREAASGKLVKRLATLKGYVAQVSFGPGGRLLAVGGRELVWWDAQGKEEGRMPTGVDGGAAFAPGGLLALTDSTRVVRLEKPGEKGSRAFGKSLPDDDKRQNLMTPTSVDFSPDGSLMAAARWDQPIQIWEVETGKLSRTAEGTLHVAWSPDGKTLASLTGTISKRGTELSMVLIDAATGARLRTLPGEARPRFAAGGTKVATLAGGEARVYEVATGALLASARPEAGAAVSFDLAPDGTALACVAADGSLTVFR